MTLFNGELPDPGQIDISPAETGDILSRLASMTDEEFEAVWVKLDAKVHEAKFYRQVFLSTAQALESLKPIIAMLRAAL
jgi:hypothetical protein